MSYPAFICESFNHAQNFSEDFISQACNIYLKLSRTQELTQIKIDKRWSEPSYLKTV